MLGRRRVSRDATGLRRGAQQRGSEQGDIEHPIENAISAANFMSDGTAFVFDVTPVAPLRTPKLVILR